MLQHGTAPFLECSSRGDRRFSAFAALIKGLGNRSIEEIYQAAKRFEDGSTGLTWREAKGKRVVNAEEVRALYSVFWDEYIAENPHLLSILTSATGLQDLFGQAGHACQATKLWRIRCSLFASPHKKEVNMADLPALSSMARKALEVLKEGGEFRYALEMSSYTRREQFKAHLKTASGRTVRGIGISTTYELKGHGLIVPTNSTSISTYYRLNPSHCSNHAGEINNCASQG